jgi:hypothetical protein
LRRWSTLIALPKAAHTAAIANPINSLPVIMHDPVENDRPR